jgi:hypothetical protein
MKSLMDQLEKGSAWGSIDSWSFPQLEQSLSVATSLMGTWRSMDGLPFVLRACAQERSTAKTSAAVNGPASFLPSGAHRFANASWAYMMIER